MGDAFVHKLSLIREWSGTVKGQYGNAAEAILILDSFINATTSGGAQSGSVTLVLYPDAATAENWSGTVFLDFALTVDKAKANEFSAKFTGTDTLTYTANS